MSVTDLKEKLSEQIDLIEDESVLQNLLLFLEMDSSESSMIVFNPQQLEQIEQAKKNARTHGVSNVSVFEKTTKCLSQ